MFGTLKPLATTLGGEAQQSYTRFYCGLCKTLGDDHGQASRVMTGHDAIFLAILADALVDEAAAPSSCRCPMMPVIHRPTLDPQSPAMRFAASMQVLLADQFLADRAMDGRRAYRAARGLLGGRVERARDILTEQGVALGDLDRFEQHQAAREAPGVTGPAEAAEPTASALARVFAQIVHLPGASYRLRAGASRRALEALGAAVGRVIYLTDALEDLHDDYLSGAFNPCLSWQHGRLGIDPARVALSTACLERDNAAIAAALRELPLRRHEALLRNILDEQLAQRALRAGRLAASVVDAQLALQQRRDGSMVQRFHMVMLAALAALWAWLAAASTAVAQQLPRVTDKAPRKPLPPRLPDAGVRAPDAGASDAGALDAGLEDCPDGGLDALLDAGDGGVDPKLIERCRKALADGGLMPDAGRAHGSLDAGVDAGSQGRHGGALGDPCSGLGSGCCDPCVSLCHNAMTGMATCCNAPADCAKCIDGCFKGCSSCGTSCNPSSFCNSCCKGCDPGSCCKSCDLGSCCKGCDCGKGCDGCCKGGGGCDSCCKGGGGCDSCCKGGGGCDGCCKGGGGGCNCAESVPTDTCGI